MSRLTMTPFLRNVLRIDSVLSAMTALMLMVDAELMAAWTGLPAGLLMGIGVGLVPWAALLGWLSSREVLPSAAIGSVVFLNACWMIDCALAAFGAFNAPQGLGVVLLGLQAVGTLVIAECEWIGMRRAPRQAALHGALAA